MSANPQKGRIQSSAIVSDLASSSTVLLLSDESGTIQLTTIGLRSGHRALTRPSTPCRLKRCVAAIGPLRFIFASRNKLPSKFHDFPVGLCLTRTDFRRHEALLAIPMEKAQRSKANPEKGIDGVWRKRPKDQVTRRRRQREPSTIKAS